MPILTRVKWAVACVALLSALGLAVWVTSLRAQNRELHGAVDALAADLVQEQKLRTATEAVATRYAATVAALTTKQESNRATLHAALEASAPWSDAAVPDAVADALGLPHGPSAPPGGSAASAVPPALPSATSAGKD